MRGLRARLSACGGTRRARRFAAAGGVVGVLILGTGLAASPSQQSARRDPFVLFQQLVPVIQHDRCVNCHGRVDPFTPSHHPMKVDPVTDECNDCHQDAVDDSQHGHWHTPQPFDFFVGKDAKALCAQFADFAMNRGRRDFIDHITNDALIKFAFLGVMAGARDPGRGTPPDPPADPPPMTHRAWVDSSVVWHDEGFAACTMDGTITQEESINNDVTHHIDHQPGAHNGDYMDNRTRQNGTRRVKISRLSNGQYQAEISLSWQSTGTLTQQMTGPNGPCTNTFTEIITHTGTTRGLASVGVKTNRPRNASFLRYFIDVELPPEQTTQSNTSSHHFNCPGPALGDAPPSTDVHQWPKNRFTIEGELLNPNDKRLVGGCDEFLLGGEPPPGTQRPCFPNLPDPKSLPYIEHMAQPSNLDGSPITVRVYTAWNFVYR